MTPASPEVDSENAIKANQIMAGITAFELLNKDATANKRLLTFSVFVLTSIVGGIEQGIFVDRLKDAGLHSGSAEPLVNFAYSSRGKRLVASLAVFESLDECVPGINIKMNYRNRPAYSFSQNAFLDGILALEE